MGCVNGLALYGEDRGGVYMNGLCLSHFKTNHCIPSEPSDQLSCLERAGLDYRFPSTVCLVISLVTEGLHALYAVALCI